MNVCCVDIQADMQLVFCENHFCGLFYPTFRNCLYLYLNWLASECFGQQQSTWLLLSDIRLPNSIFAKGLCGHPIYPSGLSIVTFALSPCGPSYVDI